MSYIEDFAAAMAGAGVPCPDAIIPDGRLHSFTVVGDRPKKDSGWYVCYDHVSYQAGAFGCCKRYGDDKITWHSVDRDRLTKVDLERIKYQTEQAKAERQREIDHRHERAAERANRIWDDSTPTETHPYLTKKHVASHGLRTSNWHRFIPERCLKIIIPAALIIPMYLDRNYIVSLQAIFRDDNNHLKRDRDFLPGGQRQGAYYRIGDAANSDTVVISEGYATTASIYQATGYTSVVAFSASNLPHVARKIRGWLPNAEIIIAADNDTETEGNPGVRYAMIAAKLVDGLVAVPRVEPGQTDFNDIYVTDGPDEVADQIRGGVWWI